MNSSPNSNLKTDFLLLAVFAGVCFGLASVFGELWKLHPQPDPLPAASYLPVFLGLAVIGQRYSDCFGMGRSFTVFIVLSLLLVFCLTIQLTVEFWAFMVPNRLPLGGRMIWIWLLIVGWHPDINERIQASWNVVRKWIRTRGLIPWGYPIFAVFLFLLAWFFRSANISPDGYDWARDSKYAGEWLNHLREPLSILVYRWSYLFFGKELGWASVTCIGVVSTLSGLIVIPLIVTVYRRLATDEGSRGWWYLMLMSSGGYVLIFISHLEVYAMLALGFWMFMAIAVIYRKGRIPIWVVGLVFGLALCVHLSIIFWLPALVAMPWLISFRATTDFQKVVEVVWAGAAMMIVPTILGTTILFMGYHGDVGEMWAFFWGDKVMAVGTDAAMFRPLHNYSDFETYLTYINFLMFLMPALPVWLVLKLSLPPFSQEWSRQDCNLCRWYWILFWPYFLYFILWRPDKHPNVDWDLFSGLVGPLMLLGGAYFVPSRMIGREWRLAMGMTVWWGGLYTIVQIIYSHAIKIMDWPIEY